MIGDKINKLSDELLVKEIVKTRDGLLFEALYDRYARVVYNKCYGFSRNEHEAKDLTQDVFLKLFIELGSFKERSKFSTWLYSFTYNFCVNYVTRNNSKKIEKQVVKHKPPETVAEEEVEDEFFLKMKVKKLKQAFSHISPEERMILLLKYQDLLSIKEIQVVLGISESAVKMRIKRAKDKLVYVYTNKLG